jgi:ribose transport system permease protein
VGSVMGLAAMTLGLVMGAGYSIEVGILAGLAVSLAVGVAHGFLIAYVNMPSFVVTLATLSIWRSQGQVWSNNAGVYKFGPDQADFFWLGGGSVYGIANPVIALVILTAVTGFACADRGCHLAIGGNGGGKADRRSGPPHRPAPTLLPEGRHRRH